MRGLGLGLGLSRRPSLSDGGGGGGDYLTGAVTLDGKTVLERINNPSADSPYISSVFWIRIPASSLTGRTWDTIQMITAGGSGLVDLGVIASNFTSDFYMDAGNDVDGAVMAGSDDGAITADTWVMGFNSADMSETSPGKKVFLYLNKTSVAEVDYTDDTGDGGPIAFNGCKVYLPWAAINAPNGQPYNPFDISDPQVWEGTLIDPTIPGVLDNFIDNNGKPRDPAVAAEAFGSPTWAFSGDAINWAAQAAAQGFTIKTRLSAGNVNSPAPLAVSLPGALVGRGVLKVFSGSNTDVSADFETTITVGDQIQQVSGDYSGQTITVYVEGVLLDAVTSPSD